MHHRRVVGNIATTGLFLRIIASLHYYYLNGMTGSWVMKCVTGVNVPRYILYKYGHDSESRERVEETLMYENPIGDFEDEPFRGPGTAILSVLIKTRYTLFKELKDLMAKEVDEINGEYRAQRLFVRVFFSSDDTKIRYEIFEYERGGFVHNDTGLKLLSELFGPCSEDMEVDDDGENDAETIDSEEK